MLNLIAKVRRILEGKAPNASKVFLMQYTGKENLPLPELILEALHRLPSSGHISQSNDNLAIMAISWLLNQIPDTDLRKSEICQLFDNVSSRACNQK